MPDPWRRRLLRAVLWVDALAAVAGLVVAGRVVFLGRPAGLAALAFVAVLLLDVECWALRRGPLAVRRAIGFAGAFAFAAVGLLSDEPSPVVSFAAALLSLAVGLACGAALSRAPGTPAPLTSERARGPHVAPLASAEAGSGAVESPAPRAARGGLVVAQGVAWMAIGFVEATLGIWWFGFVIAALGVSIAWTAPYFLASGRRSRFGPPAYSPAVLVALGTALLVARAAFLLSARF